MIPGVFNIKNRANILSTNKPKSQEIGRLWEGKSDIPITFKGLHRG